MEKTENWLKVELPECAQENVNLIALEIESDGTCSSMMEYYNAQGDAVTTYIGVAGGSDTYILEFNDAQIQQVQISMISSRSDCIRFQKKCTIRRILTRAASCRKMV